MSRLLPLDRQETTRALPSHTKAPPVAVSLTRLLCTRRLPWLAALTAYQAVAQTTSATPSPVATEALFCLYGSVRDATQPVRAAPVMAAASVSLQARRTAEGPTMTSSTALSVLEQVCAPHAPLSALHTALTQAAAERHGGTSATQTSSMALQVLSSPSTLLNTALWHAVTTATPEAWRTALDTLIHLDELDLLAVYLADRCQQDDVLDTLRMATPAPLPPPTTTAHRDGTTGTTLSTSALSASDWALRLGALPPLVPLFEYLLAQWAVLSGDGGRPPTTLSEELDVPDAVTRDHVHGEPRVPCQPETAATCPARDGNDDAVEDEDAVADTARAILRAARQRDAVHAVTAATTQAQQAWLQRASDALLDLTARLLSASARGALHHHHHHHHPHNNDVPWHSMTILSDHLYALSDVMTRSTSWTRTEAVLARLSASSAPCGVVVEWASTDAAAALQRALVLVLARAVDRAPTCLRALQTVERHWHNRRDRASVTATAQGLVDEALPVVRALTRRSFDTHALRQWWWRVVMVGTAAPLTAPEVPAVPLTDAYWSALLVADMCPSARASSSSTPLSSAPSRTDPIVSLADTLEAGRLIVEQALREPAPESSETAVVGATVRGAAARWLAQLCVRVQAQCARLPRPTDKRKDDEATTRTFEALASFLDGPLLSLFHTEAERVAMLAALLAAFPLVGERADASVRRARQSLVQALARASLPGPTLPSFRPWRECHQEQERDEAVRLASSGADDLCASPWRPQDGLSWAPDGSQAMPLFAHLQCILRDWIASSPHRMAEAVYLLDDVAIACKPSRRASADGNGALTRQLACLTDDVREAILDVGLSPPSAHEGGVSSVQQEAVPMARAWAALLASFSATHIHTTLFGDAAHVVLFYWLLDALAQTTEPSKVRMTETMLAQDGHKDGAAAVVVARGRPLTTHELEAAAQGVASVLAQSPSTSVLPPMLLNWCVSPEGLRLSWREASQFLRCAERTPTATPASCATDPARPMRGFLFLALPLDTVKDRAHAVRVLLALHYVAGEAEAQTARGPHARAEVTRDGELTPRLARLYGRVRRVLLYTWYTRSLTAVLRYFAEHPEQLQPTHEERVQLTAPAEQAGPSRTTAAATASDAMARTDDGEAARLATMDTLQTVRASSISCAVLCQYLLRERCVWHVTAAAVRASDEVTMDAPVPDTTTALSTAPAGRRRAPRRVPREASEQTPAHTRLVKRASALDAQDTPFPTHTALNEQLLRAYVDCLLRQTDLRQPVSTATALSRGDRRLLALLYRRAQSARHDEASWRSPSSDEARTRDATQRAAYFFLHRPAQMQMDQELASGRILSDEAFARLCRDTERVLSDKED